MTAALAGWLQHVHRTLPSAAQAHHRNGHSGGPPNASHQSEATLEDDSTHPQQTGQDSSHDSASIVQPLTAQPLTEAQRSFIEELLREDNNDETLITLAMRRDIRSQAGSLPPSA
jgi:hypothetical protein